MRKKTAKEVLELFYKFRDGIYDESPVAKIVISEIRKAVGSGQITWKDLGITEEEFSHMVLRSLVNSLKIYLLKLRKNLLRNINSVRNVIDKIRDAVANNKTTWDELGTTSEELNGIYHVSLAQSLREDLDNLRNGAYQSDMVRRYVVGTIRSALRCGEVTGGEIGIIDTDHI